MAILRDVLGNTFFSFSTCFVFGNDGNEIINEDKVCHKILAVFNAFATEFPLQR